MSSSKEKRNRVTKEIAMAITPIIMAFLFVAFYEAGSSAFYGIPTDLIVINFTDVFLTNRLTLMVAVIAFLWIGLYYDVLPSANSPIFKGMITVILIASLWLGFKFGWADSQQQTEYLVAKEHQEYVVLKIYGDNMILAPLLRQTKGFRKQYIIRKVNDTSINMLHLEDVGTLQPQ